jgi:hypothetical protein
MKLDSAVNSVDIAFLTIIVSLLSFGQYSIFYNYHIDNLDDLINVTVNFFQGETHWRAFQNRITGPAIVNTIDNFYCYFSPSCTYEKAIKTFYMLITIISNLTFLFLVLRLNEGFIASLGWVFSFICGQMLCLSPYHFPWDSLELLLVTIMVFSDLRRQQPYVFFYVMFAVWVLTKETAVFVPIWLLLTRFAVPANPLNVKELLSYNKNLLVISAAMIGITIVVVKLLRDSLFVKSVIPRIGDDAGHQLFGNFITPIENYDILKTHLAGLLRVYLEPQTYSSLYVILFLLAIAYVVYRIYGKRDIPPDNLRITLFSSIYLAVVFISAKIDEPRVYFPMIPILFLIFLKISREEKSVISSEHSVSGVPTSPSRVGSAPRTEKSVEWKVAGGAGNK